MPLKKTAKKRKPRADAVENRERILEIAREAFARHGANASLDEIAREAEVGPGTLYRHFPTRDSLIEAVYRKDVEHVAAAARRFALEKPPIEALRAWLLLLIDYVAAKHIIAPALNSIVGGPMRLYEATRAQMQEAVEFLVTRGIESGELRGDVQGPDLLFAVIGISNVGMGADWKARAQRLVEMLIAGARRT